MVFISQEDGRQFTFFGSNCQLEEKIKKDNNITNNYNYKLFLQSNAKKILDIDRLNSITNINQFSTPKKCGPNCKCANKK